MYKAVYVGTTGLNLVATIQRLSDDFYWNTNTSEFESAPTFADQSVALTEGSAEQAGSYSANVTGLGNVGGILVRIHNLSLSGQTIDMVKTGIASGIEFFPSDLNGSGAEEVISVTQVGANNAAVADVDVWVTLDQSGTNVIASGKTDANGQVKFYLDPGVYYVWRQKTGFDFDNPETINVLQTP